MLLLLAVVVIGGVAALVVASAASGTDGPDRGGRSTATLVLAGLGLAGILVVLAGAGLLLGRGGSGDHGEVPGLIPTTTSTPLTTDATSDVTRSPPPLGSSPVDPGPPLVEVTVRASGPDRLVPYELIDALQPDSVVRVRATGFGSFEAGRVEHCVTEIGRLPGCTPPFPVQFGEDGTADFQYLLRDSFAPGECRSGRPTCTLRVSGIESGRHGWIQTVFLDDVAMGRVAVAPPTGILDGQRVTVSVAGFPAGANLVATVCAAPGTYDPRRCRGSDGTAQVRVGPDGAGTVSLAIRAGAVGLDRVPCGPRHACGVTVVSDDGFVASPTAPIGFSLGPGAEYDPTRLVVGLAVAALLLLAGLLLIRRTSWDRPSEAATPEMDATDLETQQTLDELFGTDEEIDARYPVDF
ncbi:MAG: neocarzinostatin apoprotein domain-containing protein [Actinomycetota bacterium]|nr:neocarzinostatin apoprotein domain-containing protein [Actinomycetota bacterium]